MCRDSASTLRFAQRSVPPIASPQLDAGTFAAPSRRVENGRVSDLPRGTVTLLFTDIEGSTQLQHRLGESYQAVVAAHRRLLEAAFVEHGGVVVDRQTESFFVVFPRSNSM